MFIHIGSRVLVSDRKIVGIFNVETLRKSPENAHHLEGITDDDKTVVIDRKNGRLSGIVSPFTVIKRRLEEEDIYWRRRHD
ncbi:MAG: hypothetical protein EHM32_03920 [Spirochaetales bacterium]|nr:MAG: hypothetical protein EHM32_03920 [Spirochaetales bacterium]